MIENQANWRNIYDIAMKDQGRKIYNLSKAKFQKQKNTDNMSAKFAAARLVRD